MSSDSNLAAEAQAEYRRLVTEAAQGKPVDTDALLNLAATVTTPAVETVPKHQARLQARYAAKADLDKAGELETQAEQANEEVNQAVADLDQKKRQADLMIIPGKQRLEAAHKRLAALREEAGELTRRATRIMNETADPHAQGDGRPHPTAAMDWS
jgi:hypothetical protein